MKNKLLVILTALLVCAFVAAAIYTLPNVPADKMEEFVVDCMLTITPEEMPATLSTEYCKQLYRGNIPWPELN